MLSGLMSGLGPSGPSAAPGQPPCPRAMPFLLLWPGCTTQPSHSGLWMRSWCTPVHVWTATPNDVMPVSMGAMGAALQKWYTGTLQQHGAMQSPSA